MPLDAHRLVMSHFASAKRYARRWCLRPGDDLDDFDQEVALALCEAAQKYDPDRGEFGSFSRPFVKARLDAMVRPEGALALPDDLPDSTESGVGDARGDLWLAFDTLCLRDRTLLARRFGLDGRGGSTLTEMATEFGLSYRRLGELVRLAMVGLKAELRRRGYGGGLLAATRVMAQSA